MVVYAAWANVTPNTQNFVIGLGGHYLLVSYHVVFPQNSFSAYAYVLFPSCIID